jgi:hypothetical protein
MKYVGYATSFMQPLLASGVRGIIQHITIEVRANRQTHGELRRPAMRRISVCGKKEGGRGTLVRLSAPDDSRE